MSLSKMCCIAFVVSAAIFLLSAVVSELYRRRDLSLVGKISAKRKAILSPLQIFIIGFFASIVVIFYPIYYYDYFSAELGGIKILKSVLLSIHNTLRLFILDGDFDVIKNTIYAGNISYSAITNTYTIYSAFLFVIAPLLTASFVLSFFKNISSFVKYMLHPRADIYLMSGLNERSITLAEGIMTSEEQMPSQRKKVVLFADVFAKDEEENFELVNRANRIGAICFKKDITEITLKSLHRGVFRKIYFIGEDEDENTKQALAMIVRCRNKKYYNVPQTQFYVFANTVESEVLLNNADNGNMKVRRIRQNQNLVWDMLRTHSIFHNAYQDGEKKKISIAIVGLGRHGTELLKAVCWCAQMPGYELEVHVFDNDFKGEEQIEGAAPEFIAYNHNDKEGETHYDICFHRGVNVTSAAFLKEISLLQKLTMVYVTLGEDELNIETAMRIRMQFGRDKIDFNRQIPPILTIVYNSLKSAVFEQNKGMKSIEGDKYGITFVGSIRSRYSLDFIERPALEKKAQECHLRWVHSLDVEETEKQDKLKREEMRFEQYEYYRRASLAMALYEEMRESLGIVPGKSQEMDDRIKAYEHIRWNAYMRSEGYVHRHNNGEKDVIAKTHPDLVSVQELNEKAFKKDAAVAGIEKAEP